jgi:hypothetical protein
VTTNFDEIAQRILGSISATEGESERAADTQMIATELRIVWNARGAADIAQLSSLDMASEPSVKVLDQALRSLDR